MIRAQTTDTIVMVRPAGFRKNEATAGDNLFQSGEQTPRNTQDLALAEFNALAQALEAQGVRCIIVDDSGLYDTPDSLFPNNVISFHGSTALLYPMFAPNRRAERKLNILGALQKKGIWYDTLIDYSIYEDQHLFLEGTGALVLDRSHRIAYCSLSGRASRELVIRFCEDLGYTPMVFDARQQIEGKPFPIYHTNVMMSIGTSFAIVALDTIPNERERTQVLDSLQKTGREVLAITVEQMNHFCGNIIELKSHKDGHPVVVMSEQAFQAFTSEQKRQLASYAEMLYSPLYTIEKYGGGGARCMIAEVF